MNDCMTFPDTVEEFMEQYKVVDTEHIYTNGSEFVPIFRMKQWFEHLPSAQPKPCEDAVSREAVLSVIDTYMNKSVELHYLPTSDGIKKLISILPSVQPERKTGRWIPDNTDYYRTKFICSVCGESEEVPTTGFGYGTMWDYCPNCGAKMDGERKE